MKSVQENCPSGTKLILVGNKSDLKREVEEDTARELAKLYDMDYVETSCVLQTNIRPVLDLS
jgi:GTPase SAR1 family protein